MEIDQDDLRTGTANRLSHVSWTLAQISCFTLDTIKTAFLMTSKLRLLYAMTWQY